MEHRFLLSAERVQKRRFLLWNAHLQVLLPRPRTRRSCQQPPGPRPISRHISCTVMKSTHQSIIPSLTVRWSLGYINYINSFTRLYIIERLCSLGFSRVLSSSSFSLSSLPATSAPAASATGKEDHMSHQVRIENLLLSYDPNLPPKERTLCQMKQLLIDFPLNS